MLVVEEEEELVFYDRAAQPESGVAAFKERIREQGIVGQQRISRHVVVPEEVIGAAVQVVAAGSGDDVQGSRSANASGQVEGVLLELKLLDHFLRQVQ